MKEGLYDPDGSVYERTVYVHELIIGIGRPLRRLDQPICGTAFYKSTAYNIGKATIAGSGSDIHDRPCLKASRKDFA
jgi:hypothetical protein